MPITGRARRSEVAWLGWADLEIDNIRAVLQRCLGRADVAAGTDLAVCMGWYWITRATTEGARWLDELLAPGDGDPAMRGRGYFLRGFLAVLKGDSSAARPALKISVALARQAREHDLLAEALSMASIAENMAGDNASGRRLLDEAEVLAAGLPYSGTIATLQARALGGFFTGDLDAVRSAAEEGARRSGEAGDLYSREMMLLNLGSAGLISGDLERSKPLLAEALEIARQIDDWVAQYYLLHAFGCHAAFTGRARLAAQLMGAADTVRTGIGANIMPFLAPVVARAAQLASAAIGPARFAAESAAGRLMGRDKAVELALGKPPTAPFRQIPTARGRSGSGRPTSRSWSRRA